MTFWLHRFRKLDMQKEEHHKMLVDTFGNSVFLYDDKLLTFNFKDDTRTITFGDVQTATEGECSDLNCSATPVCNGSFCGGPRKGQKTAKRWHIPSVIDLPKGYAICLCMKFGTGSSLPGQTLFVWLKGSFWNRQTTLGVIYNRLHINGCR